MLFRTPKPFYTETEIKQILESIKSNEEITSGEIRICVESKCKYMDPMDRVRELFYQLKMYETTHRNAVLIYIAYLDKDFALFGDGAIFEKVNANFWDQESKMLSKAFHERHYVDGVIQTIKNVGKELSIHFPQKGEKKNELPDEIVFGK